MLLIHRINLGLTLRSGGVGLAGVESAAELFQAGCGTVEGARRCI